MNKTIPHPKPHHTPTPNHTTPATLLVGQACYIPTYPDVYPSSSNVPKQFTDVLYTEVKKLWVLNFISKYLLLYTVAKQQSTTDFKSVGIYSLAFFD